MIVIALRQLKGCYGLVKTGDRFAVDPELAGNLLRRGLVALPQEPGPHPVESRETKVIVPTETKPARRHKGKNLK
jgi:hypothetical protein